jgi:hypothetical protein
MDATPSLVIDVRFIESPPLSLPRTSNSRHEGLSRRLLHAAGRYSHLISDDQFEVVFDGDHSAHIVQYASRLRRVTGRALPDAEPSPHLPTTLASHQTRWSRCIPIGIAVRLPFGSTNLGNREMVITVV